MENNQSEEEAAEQIESIYAGVDHNVVLFLAATLAAIILTGVLITFSNRQLFAQLASLSEQRSELAHKLIATQESTLQFISRELHDEFGQILTAIGSLLGRAERQAPPGSTWARDLHEVRDMAQTTLDSVRSLSQALHPVVLDEAGVESAIDWYLPMLERQNADHDTLQEVGRRPCPSPELRRDSHLPHPSGSPEQRRAPLGSHRSGCRLAFQAQSFRSKSKTTAKACSPTQRDAASAWSPCANAPSCYTAPSNGCLQPAAVRWCDWKFHRSV